MPAWEMQEEDEVVRYALDPTEAAEGLVACLDTARNCGDGKCVYFEDQQGCSAAPCLQYSRRDKAPAYFLYKNQPPTQHDVIWPFGSCGEPL